MNRRSFVATVLSIIALVVTPFRKALFASSQEPLKIRRWKWHGTRNDGTKVSFMLAVAHGSHELMRKLESQIINHSNVLNAVVWESEDDFEVSVMRRSSDGGEHAWICEWDLLLGIAKKAGVPVEYEKEWREYKPYERVDSFIKHETYSEKCVKAMKRKHGIEV